MLSFDEDHYLLVKLHQTETLPANCNYAIISPAPSTNDINVKKCRERQTKGKDKQDRFFKTIFLLMQTQRDGWDAPQSGHVIYLWMHKAKRINCIMHKG